MENGVYRPRGNLFFACVRGARSISDGWHVETQLKQIAMNLRVLAKTKFTNNVGQLPFIVFRTERRTAGDR
jgi:hypothetical protein